jgi:DNA primase
MIKRYSKQTLFSLRNDISIDLVVTELLNLPSKTSDGFFRFLCPLCHEFNTATNPKTNLARCFRCHKNFNPIDLVMAEKNISFRQAVDSLLPLLPHTLKIPPSSTTQFEKNWLNQSGA